MQATNKHKGKQHPQRQGRLLFIVYHVTAQKSRRFTEVFKVNSISRREASLIACKLTLADIRQYNDRPNMCVLDCIDWKDGLSSYIESAYTGKSNSFDEIVADFNSNINRKFKTSNGKIISFCRVLSEYLSYMCRISNNGKGYTIKAFNKFLANYTEV